MENKQREEFRVVSDGTYYHIEKRYEDGSWEWIRTTYTKEEAIAIAQERDGSVQKEKEIEKVVIYQTPPKEVEG